MSDHKSFFQDIISDPPADLSIKQLTKIYHDLPEIIPAHRTKGLTKDGLIAILRDRLKTTTESDKPIGNNLPPHENPDSPVISLPYGSVNTHVHVNGDGIIYPWSPAREHNPFPAPWMALRRHNESLGFDNCVIVAATAHGTVNDMTIDSIRESKGKARGVAFVKMDVPIGELERLREEKIDGLRVSYVRRLVANPPAPEKVVALAARAKDVGIKYIDLYCEAGELKELQPYIEKMPLPIVYDHAAVPKIAAGVNGSLFQLYLHMLEERPDDVIKLGCPERVTSSVNPQDWKAFLPFAHTLIEKFPDRVWLYTDWPHPNLNTPVNDGKLINSWFPQVVRGDFALLKKILVDNPQKFHPFAEEARRGSVQPPLRRAWAGMGQPDVA